MLLRSVTWKKLKMILSEKTDEVIQPYAVDEWENLRRELKNGCCDIKNVLELVIGN